MTISSLLLLADGRFPDGTHAHSHGLEAAVAQGRVHDPASLESYVETRLLTVGATDAAAASLAARGHTPGLVDAELSVRTPSAAVRATSRALGRSLLRTADRVWPDHGVARLEGRPPMQPVVFGALASHLGCTSLEAATGVAHGMAAALTTAALRLLSMDPFSVAAVLDRLRPCIDATAAVAERCEDPTVLPHRSTPFAELDPERQLVQDLRLFGS